jgi:hypothetical protein
MIISLIIGICCAISGCSEILKNDHTVSDYAVITILLILSYFNIHSFYMAYKLDREVIHITMNIHSTEYLSIGDVLYCCETTSESLKGFYKITEVVDKTTLNLVKISSFKAYRIKIKGMIDRVLNIRFR